MASVCIASNNLGGFLSCTAKVDDIAFSQGGRASGPRRAAGVSAPSHDVCRLQEGKGGVSVAGASFAAAADDPCHALGSEGAGSGQGEGG